MQDIDIPLQHHRHQPHDGGDGREHDRPQTLGAGTHGGFNGVEAAFNHLVVGVDQNNVVIHHDTGQSNYPNAAHNNAKGFATDQQPQQYADHRQNNGTHNQTGLIKAVELSDQNGGHQKQGNTEGGAEEAAGFGHLFKVAAEFRFHPGAAPVQRLQSLPQFQDFRISVNAFGYVGGNAVAVFAINTHHIAAFRHRLLLHKVAHRHQSVRGLDIDIGELVNMALALRITQQNFDFVVTEIGLELAHFLAAGNHAD